MSLSEYSGRHDPGKRRKSQRAGAEKGIRIYIAAAELRAAGIDPDGPPPEFKVWANSTRDSRLTVNLYPLDASS